MKTNDDIKRTLLNNQQYLDTTYLLHSCYALEQQ